MGDMQRKGCLLNMKSGLLSVITDFKNRNIELRDEVVNDYKYYSLLSKQNNIIKLTISDNKIILEQDGQKIEHTVYNLNSIYHFIHTYFAKAMVNSGNANRYDVYLFDDLDSKQCEKLFYLEEPVKTNGRRAIVACTSRKIASLIREELVVVYNYIVINDAVERILCL